jgi:hypothetical protein
MAGFAELTIEQGASFSTTVTVNDANGTPTNLTGFTGVAQMRKSFYSSTATNFSVSVLNAANGVLAMTMTAANTANLSAGRMMYDLLITSPSNIKTRVVEGIVVILPSVSR